MAAGAPTDASAARGSHRRPRRCGSGGPRRPRRRGRHACLGRRSGEPGVAPAAPAPGPDSEAAPVVVRGRVGASEGVGAEGRSQTRRSEVVASEGEEEPWGEEGRG